MHCVGCGSADFAEAGGGKVICTLCGAISILPDGTRIEISGHDHLAVAEAIAAASNSAKQSRRYARIGLIGTVIAGIAAVMANFSAVATFLGFGQGAGQ
jgi:hypothetical protein